MSTEDYARKLQAKLAAIRQKAEACKADLETYFETHCVVEDLLDEIIELTR